MQHAQEIWNAIWPVLNKHYKRTATFLDHRNVWELLIAVILSAQTTDDMVNRITPALFKQYPGPKELAAADVADIVSYIKKIGYHNAKARYIKRTAEIIVERFNNHVPDTEAALRTLPGVGRKTAVVVLANGFGKNVGIAVDTHVLRFAKRFKLSRATTAEGVERDLQMIIPKKNWNRAGYAIKEYGRKEGKARPYDPDRDPLVQELKRKKLSYS